MGCWRSTGLLVGLVRSGCRHTSLHSEKLRIYTQKSTSMTEVLRSRMAGLFCRTRINNRDPNLDPDPTDR